MKTAFLKRFFHSITTPPITAESLTAYYASITDVELRKMNPALLTPLARPLWKAEMDKRDRARRQGQVATPREAIAPTAASQQGSCRVEPDTSVLSGRVTKA